MCHQPQEKLCVLLEEYMVLVVHQDIVGMCRWPAEYSYSLVVPSKEGCHKLYQYPGFYKCALVSPTIYA